MIEIPHSKISIVGGNIKKDTQVLFFACLDDDPKLVIPRLTVTNTVTKGEAYLEVAPIRREKLVCKLDSTKVFDSLVGRGPMDMPRREVIWDLVLLKLTYNLRFDLRRYPNMSIRLELKEPADTILRGSFEDCTILTSFLPDLFDF